MIHQLNSGVILKHIDKIFDSEDLRERAQLLLQDLTNEEKRQWQGHPCTEALILTLRGDYLDHHSFWEGGEFTSENAEGTAQKNAKALGTLEAIRLIAEYIEDIHTHVENARVQSPS